MPGGILELELTVSDVTPKATVMLESQRLFEVLQQIISALNTMHKSNDTVKGRLSDLEGRVRKMGSIERAAVEPEADPAAVAAMSERMDRLERRLAEAETAWTAQANRLDGKAGATDLMQLTTKVESLSTRLDSTAEHLEKKGEAMAAMVREQHKAIEEKLEREGNEREGVAKQVGYLYDVLYTTPTGVSAACNMDSGDSEGMERVRYLAKLPPFASLAQQISSAKGIALEAVETVRSDLQSAAAVQRAETQRLLDESAGRVEQLREEVESLKEERCSFALIEASFQLLKTEKADRGELGDKASRSELAALSSRLEEFKFELNSMWERLAFSASGKPERKRASISEPGFENFRQRLGDCETAIQAHAISLDRLREHKMDKTAMRELYGFLDKVTRRVDSLSNTVGSLESREVGGDLSETPDVQPPYTVKRPTSAPPYRAPIRQAAATASEQAAKPTSPTSRAAGGRSSSPMRLGNTRWSGATFVRTSSGNLTSASITAAIS